MAARDIVESCCALLRLRGIEPRANIGVNPYDLPPGWIPLQWLSEIATDEEALTCLAIITEKFIQDQDERRKGL